MLSPSAARLRFKARVKAQRAQRLAAVQRWRDRNRDEINRRRRAAAAAERAAVAKPPETPPL